MAYLELTVTFSFQNSGTAQTALAYDIEGGEPYGQVYGNTRISGKQILNFGDDQIGRTVHVYLGFIAADRSRQSDSIYMGAFEITESDDQT